MSSSDSPLRTKPVFKISQPDDSYKFQPLPEPSGSFPFRLDLQNIIKLTSPDKMFFHMAGDTGSVQKSLVQEVLAAEMIRQFKEVKNPEDQPLFLYHLGDLVYKYGEKENYYEQFFHLFENYPAPIFAIAGNHDSDINPEMPPYKSLDAFIRVFCQTSFEKIAFSHDSRRKSMTQPNVYWTLQTPLANLIGLHSNVPKFGMIEKHQQEWFIEELKAAGKEKPGKMLIVCLHHAPYSADTNHGSSRPMIEFLDSSFEIAGVKPDIVFSGHVHNYQRFTKAYADGKKVPYIVSGAGGYHELHAIAPVNSPDFPDDSELFEGVGLEKFTVGQHGFLKIGLQKKEAGVSLIGQYYLLPAPQELNKESRAVLFDEFSI